jgi:hypothetical protein
MTKESSILHGTGFETQPPRHCEGGSPKQSHEIATSFHSSQ